MTSNRKSRELCFLIKNTVSRKKMHLAIISSLVFLFHMFIGYRNAVESLYRDEPKVITMHLQELLQAGSFTPWLFQENFYTGNPFFMLPYFLLFESTPYSVRIAVIACMALASVFGFLAYSNLFGLKKAILGVLVLFTINSWLLFREADYAYMALFPTVCLYLFTRWDVKGDNLSFYALSFFSGILFYFKASVAYIMIALVLGKLLGRRKEFLNRILYDLGYKTILKGFIMFLIGLSPFLAYIVLNPHVIFLSVGGQSLEILNNLSIRLEQLTGLIHPTQAFMTGTTSLNAMTLTLITAIIISIMMRRKLDYTLSFVFFFGFFLLTPQISGFMYGHLFTLMPFIPVVILTAFEAIEDLLSDLNLHLGKLFYSIVLLTLVTNISASAVWIEYQDTLRMEPSPPDQTPRDPALATNKTDLQSNVFSNTHNGAIYSVYDLNVQNVHFIGERSSPLLTGGYYKGFDRLQVQTLNPEHISKEKDTTFLLAKKLPCNAEKGCYNASYVADALELDETYKEDKLTILDRDYIVYSVN